MLGRGRSGQLVTLRRFARHSNVAGRRSVGALGSVDLSAADHLDWPPDRLLTEARCSLAMLPNIQGLRQKPCSCSSRLTRSSYSAWTSGGRASGSDAGRGGAVSTGGHCLLCCRTADLSASMASRAVAPKAWTWLHNQSKFLSAPQAAYSLTEEPLQKKAAPNRPSAVRCIAVTDRCRIAASMMARATCWWPMAIRS